MPELRTDYTDFESLYESARTTVFRARHRDTGESTILKLLSAVRPTPNDVLRFRRELHIVSELRGDHFPDIVDARRTSDGYLIAFEDVGAESLRNTLERRRFSLEDFLGLAVSITEGLEQLHEQGIIHRDINPSNIVWNPDTDIVQLIDFGLATQRRREISSPAPPQHTIGTLSYISPEQTGRTDRVIDYRTDFYSLGVTLFELWTGRLPFENDEPSQLIHSHLARQPPAAEQKRPDTPLALSNVISRLLNKNAEARYQSARGLKADLSRCLDELCTRGSIPEFELGQYDQRRRLELPHRLIGRHRELTFLDDALQKAQQGARLLRLIRGPSGSGKTALRTRFHTSIDTERARVCTGSFEPGFGSPFQTIGGMLDELVVDLLAKSDSEVARFRHRLTEEVGADASAMVRLVPSLRNVLDVDADARSDVGLRETRHRFQATTKRFIALLMRYFRPLVLIFDDVQWADAASVSLLKWLLDDDELSHLLVVAAYRPDEIDGDHPFAQMLAELKASSRDIAAVDLDPLDREAIGEYVATALHTDTESSAPLADVVFEKTGGNPYATGRFLLEMFHRGWLFFDETHRRWGWDRNAIQAASVSENIARQLTDRIDALDDETRQLLEYASLFGRRFSLRDLAPLCDRSTSQTLELLEPAIADDLILPLSQTGFAEDGDRTIPTELAFSHEQIREAFARHIPDSQRRQTHLEISRLLRRRVGDAPSTDELFEIVDHTGRAIDCIDDISEQIDIARIHIEAARKAVESQTLSKASWILDRADQMLEDHTWSSHPKLMYSLYVQRTHIESLLGRFDLAERLAHTALGHIDDPVDRAPLFAALIRQATRRTDFDRAIALTRESLEPFEITIPTRDLNAALAEAMARIEDRLSGRPIEAIPDFTTTEDRMADASIKLLSVAQPVAGMFDRKLLLLMGLEATAITVEVGVRPDSPPALAMYGAALCALGDYARGMDAGSVACHLARRFDNQSNLAHTGFTFGALILPWTRHLSKSLDVLSEAHDAANHSGNHLFSGYTFVFELFHRFFLGDDLEDLDERISECIALGRRIGHPAVEDAAHGYRLLVRNLRGKTDGVADFHSREFASVDEFVDHCQSRGNDVTVAIFRTAYAQILVLYGRSKEALTQLERVERDLDVLLGTFDAARFPFWKAMALADVATSANGASRRQAVDEVRQLRDTLESRAETNPDNFRHKLLLVDAELARLTGDIHRAMNGYDEAIEQARQADVFHLEALANERAGQFWDDAEKPQFSTLYLRNARDGYRLWKAHRKATLIEEHPHLEPLKSGELDRSAISSDTTGDVIDIDSVFKSLELIASRIELDELLPTLLEVSLENAGAQRGAFIDAEDDQLTVAVEGRIDEEPMRHDEPLSIDDWEGGARSVVRYVHRTGKEVVLGNAYQNSRFRADPYIRSQRTRSVLSLPVAEHSRLRGVLYVENNLIEDAFTDERTRVLGILAGHIAVALHKARLYAQLHAEKERFRQLAENIQEVFWLMDWPTRSIIYVSPAYEAVWGRPVPAEPLSIDQWLEPVADKDRRRVANALRDDAVAGNYDETYRVCQPGGGQRWIRDRGFPIRRRDHSIERIVGVAMDITREREVAKMKDELLSIVSHELRTPLTPIIGVFSMLDDQYRNHLPSEVGDMIHLGLRNSRRLLRLVDDLLDVQRLSRGEMKFEMERFDIGELVEEAVQFQEPIAESSEIEFRYNRPPQPLMVDADRSRLLQVVRNLLSNAMKFSDDDSTVDIAIRRLDDTVQLAVTDHGPGIPAELHDQIFDKFTQADSSLTRRHGGTGLGLAIAHSIVEKLDGRIYFDTEIGEGTTFFVDLPAADHTTRDSVRRV